jgi:hypothetical protein
LYYNRWVSEEETPNSKYPRAFDKDDVINTPWRDFFATDESISFSVQHEEAFLIVMLLRHVIFCAAIEGYAHTTTFYTPLIFI